jgi:N-acetylneuraminic acid mutarotase
MNVQKAGATFLLGLVGSLLFVGCGASGNNSGNANAGSGGGSTPTAPPSPTANEWTWMSGSNTAGAVGVYGTLGVAAASNVPGARQNATSWTDSSGNLWLFGGAPFGSSQVFNDLWEFSPATKEWTWVGGSSTANSLGVYGTQGIASPYTVPGARAFAISWIDNGGNFWLFGGGGYDSMKGPQELNDLWEFSPTTKLWTWMSGSSLGSGSGSYGAKETPSVANLPGARSGGVGWADASGNFWIFGGLGFDATSQIENDLNDLWEFSPTTKEWTWISGSSTGGAPGVYGALGVPAAGDAPGARLWAVSWADNSGNLWLFGGQSLPLVTSGIENDLNDLWEFSPASKTWTWISGSNTAGAPGVYGTQGVASPSSSPGARFGAVSWTDSGGDLWLFGGGGASLNATGGLFNDLWKYSPSAKTWTWVGGSDNKGIWGVYGTQGIPAASNVPGARISANSWIDQSGNFWLFGGEGAASAPAESLGLNDLWRYQP